jgi:hypothetical protein
MPAAVTHHAKAPGIIDDDEVGPAALDELRTDASAGAGGNDGIALLHRRAQAIDDFFACVGISFSSPGIRHSSSQLILKMRADSEQRVPRWQWQNP